jgi:hypothetical protein
MVNGNRRIVRRPQRRVGAMHGLANGVAFAYRNRNAIASVGRNARAAVNKLASSVRKMRVSSNKRRRTANTRSVGGGGSAKDQGSGAELQTSSYKLQLGTSKHLLSKLVYGNVQKVYNRWQSINPFMNVTALPSNAIGGYPKGGGGYALLNAIDANGRLNCPLHLFDITSTNNVVEGSFVGYNPSWQMTFPNYSSVTPVGGPDAYVLFNNMTQGTVYSSTQWDPESIGRGITRVSSVPGKRCLLKYVNVRMLCYGMTNMATKFEIDVIQLKEDYLHPDIDALLPYLNQYQLSATDFWQTMVKKQVTHPINNMTPKFNSQVRYLKRISFILQPRLTNESDALIGHSRQVNLYIPMNRVCTYDWTNQQPDPGIESVNSYQRPALSG